MLQHRFAERREPDDHVGRQAPGSSGKFSRPKRGVPPSADVMFQTAVRCPISSTATRRMARRQRAVASASSALRPSATPLPQAERRVEIGTHEVVFQLGGFVELVDQRFAGNAGIRVMIA